MKKHILIVDDDPEILESIREYIELSGYSSYTAPGAEEALEFLKTNPVDVIISDIMMKGMNGLQLIEIVKAEYEVGIIIMTGFVSEYTYEEVIGKGADDFIYKPARLEELVLRLQKVIRQCELEQERNRLIRDLKRLAIVDELTQLYNSRHFYELLSSEVYRFNRYQRPLSLLMMDIDHFKLYNDTYGHLEGDRILSDIGAMIKKSLRAMDTAYRYGGEEFMVILPETEAKEAVTVAERIHCEIGNIKNEVLRSGAVTMSSGITEYAYGETIYNFIRRVDKAMYLSKEKGRDMISILMAESVS